jgi:hypothetical protein
MMVLMAEPDNASITDPVHFHQEVLEAERVAVMVYAAITILGVVAASSLKQFVNSEGELIAAAVGASLAVALAHAWAAVMGHRLVHHEMMSRQELWNQVRIAGNLLAVTVLTVATILLSQATGASFEATVWVTQGMLVLLLFLVGFIGARWSGASWIKAMAWGVLDALIGIGILLVKVVVGG